MHRDVTLFPSPGRHEDVLLHSGLPYVLGVLPRRHAASAPLHGRRGRRRVRAAGANFIESIYGV